MYCLFSDEIEDWDQPCVPLSTWNASTIRGIWYHVGSGFGFRLLRRWRYWHTLHQSNRFFLSICPAIGFSILSFSTYRVSTLPFPFVYLLFLGSKVNCSTKMWEQNWNLRLSLLCFSKSCSKSLFLPCPGRIAGSWKGSFQIKNRNGWVPYYSSQNLWNSRSLHLMWFLTFERFH